MRVLIIGPGYVGQPLGALLVRAGHVVHGLRRRPDKGAELEAVGITPIAADITRAEALDPIAPQYDWVVLSVASSGGGVEDYRRVYLDGARNVLAWLMSHPPKKLIYTSSTSVYGQTDGPAVDETSPTEPKTETSRVLVETEQLLLEAARQNKFPAVVLRLAGIYGPGRGYWLKQYLKGEARIEGRGERWLNMIHRDDVIGAAVRALERAPVGSIVNVVDDEPVSQIQMFEWMSQRLHRDQPPVAAANPDLNRKRGITNKRVLNRKLRSELGYQLKYPTFREGYEMEIRRLGEAGELPRQ